MITLAVVDTETGGLDPREHCILDLAACVLTIDKGRFALAWQEHFHRHIKPDRPVSARAAEVNGYCPEAWADAAEPREALDAFRLWVKRSAAKYGRLMWTGCNPVFDIKFFNSDRKRHDVGEPDGFSYRICDVQSMALPLLFTGELKSLALASLREWAGAEGEQSHDALGDVRDTCNVVMKLCKRVVF